MCTDITNRFSPPLHNSGERRHLLPTQHGQWGHCLCVRLLVERRLLKLVAPRGSCVPWAKYPGLHFLATAFLDTVAVPLLVTYYEAECLCIQMHFCFKLKNEWNKSKNQMKLDVRMSRHGKVGIKKMPSTRQKVIHNPIPTSLLLSLAKAVYDMYSCIVCMLTHSKD